jgi:protein-S-isoprenylcysteine O-methyltransferase
MARISASSSSAGISSGSTTTTTNTTNTNTNTNANEITPTTTPEHANTDDDLPDTDWDEDVIDTSPLHMDDSLFPGGSRDLSWIALQALFLGIILATGVLGTLAAVAVESAWWRLPAFATALAVFHFLEYYTTARYNTNALRAESFLLFNNGRAYNCAHGLATVELVVSRFFPHYGRAGVHPVTIAVGVALVVVGQAVRSLAMAQAGPSFNHVVAREHKETHKLVTHGFYSVFRHPSYFGFFYWAIGTQLLVGNKVCLVGYVLVLWKFFYSRIQGTLCPSIDLDVCFLDVRRGRPAIHPSTHHLHVLTE